MTQFKDKAGKDSRGRVARPVRLSLADGGRHPALQGDARAGGRGPEAASRADARHRHQVQQRLRASPTSSPITEPLIFGADHARDEPARRHQEDEQVRPVGLLAHQPHRRCRRHRPEDPPRQDRSRCRCPTPWPTPRSGPMPTICWASTPPSPTRRRTRSSPQFAGRQFSEFKAALTELAVAKLGPIGAEMQRLMKDPWPRRRRPAQRRRAGPRRSPPRSYTRSIVPWAF
jgi:hypothetical protein